MRVLVATNHLQDLAGSETVAFEVVQHFLDAGDDVTVFANWAGGSMESRFERIGLDIRTDPAAIRPLSFDLVYLQHQVAGLFDFAPHPDDRDASLVAFGRLSPKGLLESGGWAHDAALGDLVLANSPETARGLAAAGNTLPVEVFHNAAPEAFHRPREDALPERPRTILVVTNRRAPDLLEAITRLSGSAQVRHVGLSGEQQVPVDADLIQQADLVITIGKTVQYALAARTSVFVYDHFGGPGYLDAANFDRAMDVNFSGRCTPPRPSAEALADEILAGFAAGRRFVASLGADILRKFHLPTFLDALAQRPRSANEARRARLHAQAPAILRERAMATYLRDTYRDRQHLGQRYNKLRNKNMRR